MQQRRNPAGGLQRFEREKGKPFSENGTIICIDTVDATKEGGG
ncbi:hypothetical protein [Nitrosomonas sp. Nm132]|nr:hypothetical protein [Nitrosomonas sp. Nm132]